MKKYFNLFCEIRFSLYLAIIINGIFVQWIIPLKYRCNISGEDCITCGLRTAVNLILKGKLIEAYESNKLIIGILLIVIIMLGDSIIYFAKKFRKYKAR